MSSQPSPIHENEDALRAAHDLAALLHTGLDRPTLEILAELVELGVNPEALAAAVQELRAEAARIPGGGDGDGGAPPAGP